MRLAIVFCATLCCTARQQCAFCARAKCAFSLSMLFTLGTKVLSLGGLCNYVMLIGYHDTAKLLLTHAPLHVELAAVTTLVTTCNSI